MPWKYRHYLPFLLLLAAAGCAARKELYPDRWVFVTRGLGRDQDVQEIGEIVKTSAEHGLNGIVLTAGLDKLDLAGPDYLRRLDEVKKICGENGQQIVPVIFSVGYGSSTLAHDKNLAAGFPVKDVLFVARKSEALHVAQEGGGITNGGFESYEGDRVKGFDTPGSPGKLTFVDRQVFAEGRGSLRFENFGEYPDSGARVRQKVAVHPHRSYRVSCRVRQEGLRPGRAFRVYVYGLDGRRLTYFDPEIPDDGAWHAVVLGLNSWGCDTVEVVAGAEEAKNGRFWLDDLRLEETGLVNVLRRAGCPLEVRSEKDGTIYEEGLDYAHIEDPGLNFRFDHEGPAIKIPEGSRIKEGERLRVSWYHGMLSVERKGQVTVCMSEPEVYDDWRTQARLIHQYLAPQSYFLDMDEIRAGGTCQACVGRGLSMGEMLGDCITRQAAIIREVNPRARIFIWSDMLDPNHNASDREGKYYYHANGNYAGSWEHIPKDLIITCWWDEKRHESLEFFSGQGFKTFAGAYYDADDLENVKNWLAALDETPAAQGVMYTTWQDKYALLAGFGDLVSSHLIGSVAGGK